MTALVAAAALTGSMVPGASAASAAASPTETVIVTSGAGLGIGGAVAAGLPDVSAAVLGAGGQIVNRFGGIAAVEARLPAAGASALAALPGVTVSPDLPVSVQGGFTDSAPSRAPAAVFPEQTGATQLEAQGDSGQGVTVAVLDTGIDDLPDFAGRLIGGVDLSGGGNPFDDQYGHGTFVAGLIAGDGASSGGEYAGEAPGADLVSIKVAGATGTTDMATVIQGILWAIANKSLYNIRVLNLSLGFQPLTSTVLNPVDMAVEAAWNAGITVVTSAGNAGPFNGTTLSPGDDPLVITVGALDDGGQTDVADDTMTDFSSAGPTSPDGWAKPDLVTSGRSVVSVAAPGSTVYDNNPSARIGAGNFVGSGTSFSSAITSGAAALVIADHPGITPNGVKGRLLATTDPGPVGNPFVDGHGALDAYAAATSQPIVYNQSSADEAVTAIGATVPLAPTGLLDTWNPSLWSGVTWPTDSQWNGGPWNGLEWSGSQWNGFTWTDSQWNAASWTDSQWNSVEWAGASWTDSQWNASAWDGASWTDSQWNSSEWN